MDVAPSGHAIVFNAIGTGGRDLYVLRLDDLRVERVADTPEYETEPSFSRDGKYLVYSAGKPGEKADHIFKRPVSGGPARQLTHADANDSSPRFSPDGGSVVFARDKTNNWGGLAAKLSLGGVICVVQSDGTNERQITPDGEFAWAPTFSADGQAIIFSTTNGLRSVPADGSEKPKSISGPSGAVANRDRSALAYSKGQYASDTQIYIANADGSSERSLTPSLGGCRLPVFAPDGGRVYFFREQWPDGPSGVPKFNLWEVDVHGAGSPRELADRRLFDAPLEWTPKPLPK
jgi:TolB protein